MKSLHRRSWLADPRPAARSPVMCIQDHWRKNLPALGQHGYRAFSIDLLGYGYSDKPSPRDHPPNELYCFETWARQVEAFVQEVVKPEDGVYVVTNSVGGLAGLQLCLDRPDLVNGLIILNISLRMLHVKKQPALLRPFVKALQTALRETPLGGLFFGQVATPKGVRNVLEQAYHDKGAVTDELIDVILKPGLEPGALPVFLDFISYSSGPLPEELLPQIKETPVVIGWGEKDPWCVRNKRRMGNGWERAVGGRDWSGHCFASFASHARRLLLTPFTHFHIVRHTGSQSSWARRTASTPSCASLFGSRTSAIALWMRDPRSSIR